MNVSNMTSDWMLENSTMGSNMTTTTEAPPDPDAHYYQLAEDVFVVIDPILTTVGIIGNILTFLVMQQKSLKKSPVAVYMSALAIVDSLVLFLDFINNWLKMKPKIYLLGYSGFCQFHRYFFNVCYTYAAWLVASVAFERFLVVWFPFKAKTLCTVKVAIKVVVSEAVILVVLYAYNFWGW